MEKHEFANINDLNQDLATRLAAIISDAIEARGQAYLALSGGKTPRGLFQELAKRKLPWSKVTLTLTDERNLNPLYQDSNEQMLRECLLKDKASKAEFISLYSHKPNLSEQQAELKRRLESLPNFDAVVLGLGEDGHTASLFPCAEELNQALTDKEAIVLPLKPRHAPYPRFSLTKARLIQSQHHFVYFTGEKKMRVFKQALELNLPLTLPIAAFLHEPGLNIQIMYSPLCE